MELDSCQSAASLSKAPEEAAAGRFSARERKAAERKTAGRFGTCGAGSEEELALKDGVGRLGRCHGEIKVDLLGAEAPFLTPGSGS